MLSGQIVVTARVVLGVVFAVAAAGKLRSRQRFTELAGSLAPLGGPSTDWRPVAAVLVAGEAGTAVLLALPATTGIGLAASTTLLVGLSAGIARVLRRGRVLRCRCFGSAGAPLRRTHLVRNGLLAALSGGALLAHLSGPATVPLGLAAPPVLLGAFLAVLVVRWDDLAALLTPVHRP